MFAHIIMKSVFVSIGILFVLISSISGPGCANIIPPSGGPADSLPPVLVEASPPDSTLNFKGNRIVLTFDEYVNLGDVSNNLLFTPIFNITPVVDVRLRTITVRLKDTLEANTTYTFNFGNAIRDINENNILRDYVYTFSTGPALDSLILTGKVTMAETGTIDTTLTVLLHKNLADSAIVNDKPRYVARVKKDGSFTFNNLPSGTFAVYALGDAGLNRKYLNKTQAFAFADSPIIVSPGAKPITLYAYKEVAGPATSITQSTPAILPKGKTADQRLRFTPGLSTGMEQDLLKDYTLKFDVPLRFFDSTKMRLSTDSTFNPVSFSSTLDSAKKVLTLKTQWLENKEYHLILEKDFAEDTTGKRLLKTDTLNFSTKGLNEYGQVNIRLKGIDASMNPTLQFVQNNVVVFAAPVSTGSFNRNMFLPGEYELRLLYDKNGNGIWDAGRFFGEKRQPELVRPIERRLSVKPNFNNDIEIQL